MVIRGQSSAAFPSPELDPIEPARSLPDAAPLAARIPPGRLVEIAGGHCTGAQTTAAVACVVYAQTRGETVAWIQPRSGSLYPPDLDECGVDLDALVIVRVPPSAGPHGSAKAAEILLRSGGFGMVVVDLRDRDATAEPKGPRRDNSNRASYPFSGPKLSVQSRLLALAREHGSTVLLLTRTGAALGSLVALRVEPRRTRIHRGCFAIEHHVLKDKTGLFSTFAPDLHRGPSGLV